MKILTIIPARKNSKRLPGKNIKLLNGIPLIEYIIKVANQLPSNFDVVVNSDNLEIKTIVDKYPNINFLERPESLASDLSPAIDYILHTISSLSNNYDAVLLLQPTSPFTIIDDILKSVEKFEQYRPSTLVSIVKVNHMFHPDKFKMKNDDSFLQDYFLEEKGTDYQSLAEVYVRNCSIYLTDIDVIQKKKKIIDNPCIGYEMPPERSIDINNQLDFDFAEFLLKRNG